MWLLEEQAWRFTCRRLTVQQSHSSCVHTTRACQKRTADALQRSKRSHWGTAAPAPSRRSLNATLKPSETACANASNCPMILREVASASPEADAKRRQSNTRT